MDGNKSWSSGFEFVDIEIIDHSKQTEATLEKWNCDQCSLFFLSKQKLNEHKKKHGATEEIVKCQYCNKTLSDTEESKECYSNKKCETCEYRCSKCPQRFLRHSSLINHENNHVLLKKRKSVLTRPIKKDINGVEPTNGLNTKATKKKLVAKKKETAKQINKKNVSLRKKQKVQSEETPSEESDDGDSDEYFVSPTKKPKQALKRNKTEESPVTVKNTTTTIMSSKPHVPSTSTPVSSNTVNYKPFSCHVCGDTFASDNTLLEHIKSHGENAGNGFKCKHCGDEFDDIYKMQYHLAICPLAEDEMETSLLQSIPAKFQKKPTPVSDGTVRKRGRRKKVHDTKAEETSEIVDNADDLTPSLGTRGSRRKRKMEEEAEAVNNTPKVTSSSLPKRATKLRSFAANDVPAFNESADNGMDYADDGFKEDCQSEDPFETSLVNESYENEEDDRKKVHACPFPRCSIKFTREKALLCHMRNHNDDFDDALKCHKCDIPFDDLQSLRTHIDICKGIKEEKDDDFEQPSYVDAYDSGDKPFNTFQRSRGQFLCKICGRAYITQEKLDRHLDLHRSSDFVCRICKDVFINQLFLDKHFSIRHPAKSPFHCNICKEDFISELFLQIHQAEYHKKTIIAENPEDDVTEESSVEAPTPLRNETKTLPKSSLRLKTLQRHSYKNTVEKDSFTNRNKSQFWCPVCLANFDQRENLRLHFHTEHAFETDSVFVCDVCEVEKPSAEMLCYHLEVHSNNLLSVNRFSRLRACIKSKGELGESSSTVKEYGKLLKVKSEPCSADEDEIEPNQVTTISNKKTRSNKRSQALPQNLMDPPKSSDVRPKTILNEKKKKALKLAFRGSSETCPRNLEKRVFKKLQNLEQISITKHNAESELAPREENSTINSCDVDSTEKTLTGNSKKNNKSGQTKRKKKNFNWTKKPIRKKLKIEPLKDEIEIKTEDDLLQEEDFYEPPQPISPQQETSETVSSDKTTSKPCNVVETEIKKRRRIKKSVKNVESVETNITDSKEQQSHYHDISKISALGDEEKNISRSKIVNIETNLKPRVPRRKRRIKNESNEECFEIDVVEKILPSNSPHHENILNDEIKKTCGQIAGNKNKRKTILTRQAKAVKQSETNFPKTKSPPFSTRHRTELSDETTTTPADNMKVNKNRTVNIVGSEDDKLLEVDVRNSQSELPYTISEPKTFNDEEAIGPSNINADNDTDRKLIVTKSTLGEGSLGSSEENIGAENNETQETCSNVTKDIDFEGEGYLSNAHSPDRTTNNSSDDTNSETEIKNESTVKKRTIRRKSRKVSAEKVGEETPDETPPTSPDVIEDINLEEESDLSNDDTKKNENPQEKTDEASKEIDTVDADNSQQSVVTSSGSETNEEICCTMCSLSFYKQDELLDHLSTHIFDTKT